MAIQSDGSTTAKVFGGIAVAIVLALGLVDFVVLRGEHVDGAMLRLTSGDPALLAIHRIGEEHTLEISTRRRSGGKTEGRSVSYRLEDPEGRILLEESEIVSRKKRLVRFEPHTPGQYRLFVEDPALIGRSHGDVHVTVYVNDRRILGRFLPF